MIVNNQITINQSADHVWNVIGGQFNDVSRWAVRMLSSKANENVDGLGGRIVNTVEYGEAFETLYQFDNEQRQLAYNLRADGIPPMLKDVTTAWQVEAQGENASVARVTFQAGLMMPEAEGMLSERVQVGLSPLLAQLKHYAETGEPHPDKQAQLAELSA